MRILLLKPYQKVPAPLMAPPLGILSLTAALRERFGSDAEVEVVDMKVRRLPPEWLAGKLDSFKPDVVGVSALNCEAQSSKRIASIVKERDPAILTVLGGPYAHLRSEELLSSTPFDWSFNGPADRSFPEALARRFGGRDLGTDLAGFSYKTTDGIHAVTDQDTIHDLDSLPLPAWDLIDFDVYARERNQMAALKGRRYATLFTSRGCPYRCNYCHDIFGKRFFYRSPDNVLREIEYLHEERGIDEFQIVDDIFNLNKERVREIMGEVKRRWGGKLHFCFPNGLRGDILDAPVLDALRDGGTYAMAIAIESVTPRLQKLMDKRLKVEKALWAINAADERGIMVMGFFMLGFPTETPEEIAATIDFALKSRLTMANFFHVVPQVATPLYALAERESPEALEISVRDEEVDGASYRGVLSWYERAYGYPLSRHSRRALLRFYLSPRRIVRILRRYPLKSLHLAVAQFLSILLQRRNEMPLPESGGDSVVPSVHPGSSA